MAIVAFISQKGGVGKSTLARGLAKRGVNLVRVHGALWKGDDFARIDRERLDGLHAFVAALKREFIADGPHGRLISLVRPACNRPFLNTEHLEAALKLYGIHEREDLTPADIVNHARLMNGWYAADHNRVGAKYTQGILDNAVRYKFFLGLDPKCQWLIGLKLTPDTVTK